MFLLRFVRLELFWLLFLSLNLFNLSFLFVLVCVIHIFLLPLGLLGVDGFVLVAKSDNTHPHWKGWYAEGKGHSDKVCGRALRCQLSPLWLLMRS